MSISSIEVNCEVNVLGEILCNFYWQAKKNHSGIAQQN